MSAATNPELATVLLVYRVDALLRSITRRPPPRQHKVPGAVRGQILGNVEPDRTQPSSNQIRSCPAQFQMCRGLLFRTPAIADPSRPPASRSAIWSSVAGPARMWPINPNHSSSLPLDKSAIPPQSAANSEGRGATETPQAVLRG